ncbi:MAG: phytanoyl-CoA dioxygenase family protein [Verrucomicrobiaceae bacterium]
MRPPERRREFLTQEGYAIVRGFFSRQEITAVAAAQDAYYRGETDSSPAFDWPAPRTCRARTRKHPYASFFQSPIASLLRDGRLAQLVSETTGMPAIRFWHDQLLYDEPRPAGEIKYHWHRENSRWLTCQASIMATAWIPLCDFTHDMGPITIVPTGRSKDDHKRMALQMGDLVIFPSQTLHGNPPNFSETPRRALAAHFASSDLRYHQAGKFSHVNERLVRKINGLPDFTDPRVCPLITPSGTSGP